MEPTCLTCAPAAAVAKAAPLGHQPVPVPLINAAPAGPKVPSVPQIPAAGTNTTCRETLTAQRCSYWALESYCAPHPCCLQENNLQATPQLTRIPTASPAPLPRPYPKPRPLGTSLSLSRSPTLLLLGPKSLCAPHPCCLQETLLAQNPTAAPAGTKVLVCPGTQRINCLPLKLNLLKSQPPHLRPCRGRSQSRAPWAPACPCPAHQRCSCWAQSPRCHAPPGPPAAQGAPRSGPRQCCCAGLLAGKVRRNGGGSKDK
jgi:hypothetical protein